MMNDITNQIEEVTIDELQKGLSEQFKEINESFLPQLKIKIKNFLNKVDNYYKSNASKWSPSIEGQKEFFEKKKEWIYKDFFEIQNLINLYLNQKIIMTYVFTDSDGNKEIRISENDVEHLKAIEGYNKKFAKLSYVVENEYKRLKNNIDNEGLDATAKEVERRYEKYKKIVLWNYRNKWSGYYFPTKGPINEAYVNFYVHEIQLLNSLEQNIATFILHRKYGAINADQTKGYAIGDVSLGGLQFAVKGLFGSPQGTIQVINALREIQNQGFTHQAFYSFIEKFTTKELEKNYEPQIKQIVGKALDDTILKIEKSLTK